MFQDTNDFQYPPRKIKARYGQRLDASVYDPQGVLLLRKGKIVQELHWVPRLEGQGIAERMEDPGPSKVWSGWGEEQPPAPEADPREEEARKLKEEIQVAGIARQTAAQAVASVFERISRAEPIDVGMLRAVVSRMMASLIADPRALLSAALLKDADNYTHTHSANVAVLAMCLAMEAGRGREAEEIGIGGLVHDIGKIQIPDAVLHKPAALDDAEALIMRQHPTIGARLLENSGAFSSTVISCARDHHESVNGRGYPIGRKGNEICPQAQMISIGDVYDALTTDRPYRPALLPEQALKLMTNNLADAFDPALLGVFVRMVGYHPVGSMITLANGYGAVVVQNDSTDPTKPALVQALTAPDGSPIGRSVYIDIRTNAHMLRDDRADDTVIDRAAPLVMREMRGFNALA